jgi:hypothetical protein
VGRAVSVDSLLMRRGIVVAARWLDDNLVLAPSVDFLSENELRARLRIASVP